MIYNVTLNPTEIKLMPASTVEEILQNVRTIIRTMRGSVPMYREFGISTEIIDAPANVVRSRFMAAAVDAINRFEPRAKLKKIIQRQSDVAGGKVDFLIQVELSGY